MSLTTTMGIELTYVPAAIQIAIDRGASIDPAINATGENELIAAFAKLMRKMVEAKKIPLYNEPGTDPGCVEIRTKPYRKLSTLLSIARRLAREANALGLVTHADYSSGGGAHIHTGIIGSSEQERNMYAKRMMLFGAMNPWIAWATLNVVDDINAKPITREHLRENAYGESYSDSEHYLKRNIRNARRDYIDEVKCLHTESRWCSSFTRQRDLRDVNHARRCYVSCKLDLFRKQKREVNKGPDERNISDILYTGDKDHMMRHTSYGSYGTIEFRSFEMGDEAKLKRGIILANAICRYVEKLETTTYNQADVMSAEQMRAMKWSEAKRGWLNMLAMLGLDPAEYRIETAQIANRWRYSMRDYSQHPSAADMPRGMRNVAEDEARERAREAETVARARARNERRQNRRAPRPSAIAPEVDPYSLAA